MNTPTTRQQLESLRERARLECPRFVNPAYLRGLENLVRRRDRDWCTAVIGRHFHGLRFVSSVEAHLLVLADDANLEPALPEHIVVQRAAAGVRAAEHQARAVSLAAHDQRTWEQATANLTVGVEVRPNATGRRRTLNGVSDGPLRHVVPLSDATSSGRGNKIRTHPSGRPLCETVNRAKPRRLGSPVDQPATCVSCLKLVATITGRNLIT